MASEPRPRKPYTFQYFPSLKGVDKRPEVSFMFTDTRTGSPVDSNTSQPVVVFKEKLLSELHRYESAVPVGKRTESEWSEEVKRVSKTASDPDITYKLVRSKVDGQALQNNSCAQQLSNRLTDMSDADKPYKLLIEPFLDGRGRWPCWRFRVSRTDGGTLEETELTDAELSKDPFVRKLAEKVNMAAETFEGQKPGEPRTLREWKRKIRDVTKYAITHSQMSIGLIDIDRSVEGFTEHSGLRACDSTSWISPTYDKMGRLC